MLKFGKCIEEKQRGTLLKKVCDYSSGFTATIAVFL